jgi:hypothetical protein
MANVYWYVHERSNSTDRKRSIGCTLDEILTFDCDRYGYHMPRTHARDNYYTKLEAKRAEEAKE